MDFPKILKDKKMRAQAERFAPGTIVRHISTGIYGTLIDGIVLASSGNPKFPLCYRVELDRVPKNKELETFKVLKPLFRRVTLTRDEFVVGIKP
jgi:hypothetical protein